MPALGTPNADSGALAHLVGFGPLDEKVHAFYSLTSGPADVLPGRVVPRVKPLFLRVNSLTLKKPKKPRVRAALSIRRSCLFRGAASNLYSM